MDCRYDAHQSLGDLYFRNGKNPFFTLVKAYASDQPRQIDSALEHGDFHGKNPGIQRALAAVRVQLKAVFAVKNRDIPEASRASHERLLDELMQSPILLALATGDRKTIGEAIQWHGRGDDTREYVKELLLPSLDITFPTREPPTDGVAKAEAIMAGIAAGYGEASQRAWAEAIEEAGRIARGGGGGEPPRRRRASAGGADGDIPRSAQGLKDEAEAFVRAHLPEYHRWRCHMMGDSNHTIVIKLNNDRDVKPIETNMPTYQPDPDQAVRLKEQVQARLLEMSDEGLDPYRGPRPAGRYDLQWDECIPNGRFTTRTFSDKGQYYVELKWDAAENRGEEMMSFALGLLADNQANRTANLPEARRRTRAVEEFIHHIQDDFQRSHPGYNRPYLPDTKRDIRDIIRERTMRGGGHWETPDPNLDLQYMSSVTLSVRGEDGEHPQRVRMQVNPMKAVGRINPTWELPLIFFINGERLSLGNGYINLHTSDERLARDRAVRTVEHILGKVRDWGGPDRGAPVSFAVDPDRSRGLRLLDFTKEEHKHAAAPNRIDYSGLSDILNECRFMHQRDLFSRVLNETEPDANGYINFTLSLTRGMMGDRIGGNAPETVYDVAREGMPERPAERHFRIHKDHKYDSNGRNRINALNLAVTESLQNVISAAYDPWSNENYNRRRQSEPLGPRQFQPDYAPKEFYNAVEANRRKPGFAYILPVTAPNRNGGDFGIRPRRHAGFADRLRGDFSPGPSTEKSRRW